MNPYLTILEVLRHLLDGFPAVGAVVCSPCVGAECKSCGGVGQIPLSSIRGDEPEWRAEAEMIVANNTPMGLRSRVLRTVVVPIIQVNTIMSDGDVQMKRRAETARGVLARCSAEDWRSAALRWVDDLEAHG